MYGLDELADVYIETTATGKFTTLVRSSLSCRLLHIPLQRAQNQTERKELAALRNMIFEGDYQMPEACQIEVDGVRWEPRVGTTIAYRDWNGEITYRRCDVFRQQVNLT